METKNTEQTEKMGVGEILGITAVAIFAGIAVLGVVRKHSTASKLYEKYEGKKSYHDCVRQAIEMNSANSWQTKAMK